MAKKNSFLDAIEDLEVKPRKIEGIQIGENYSSKASHNEPVKAQKKPVEPIYQPTAVEVPKKPQNKPTEPTKHFEPIQRPKKIKLTPKIVNKPEKEKVSRTNVVFNEAVPLDVNLLFLKGLPYDEQIKYFATNGWWIQLERFKGVYWEVAIRYIDKRKYRIYVKQLEGIPNYDNYSKVDMLKIEDMTADERRIYLCRRGWSIKAMQRGKSEYEYATKYINRKKKHIYIGAYAPGTTKQIFL